MSISYPQTQATSKPRAESLTKVPSRDHQHRSPVGVVCLNIGSPASPRRRDVRRYLSEFLSDPRVIQPWYVRLLVGTLVPFLRAGGSARRYRSIWRAMLPDHPTSPSCVASEDETSEITEQSPLIFHGDELVKKLSRRLNEPLTPSVDSLPSCTNLPDYHVLLAMNYSAPRIGEAIKKLERLGVQIIVVIPFYPHYATSSFGASLAPLYRIAARLAVTPQLRVMAPYFDHPGFIRCEALRLKKYLSRHTSGSVHVVMSYHGIPVRQCREARGREDLRANPLRCGSEGGACCAQQATPQLRRCYRWQCVQTSLAIAGECSLTPSQYTTAFQSRLGPAAWTTPTTTGVLAQLCGDSSLRAIIVMVPSFISDGLETLEEMAFEARLEVRERRPDLIFTVVPCGNSSNDLVEFFTDQVRSLAAVEHVEHKASLQASNAKKDRSYADACAGS